MRGRGGIGHVECETMLWSLWSPVRLRRQLLDHAQDLVEATAVDEAPEEPRESLEDDKDLLSRGRRRTVPLRITSTRDVTAQLR